MSDLSSLSPKQLRLAATIQEQILELTLKLEALFGAAQTPAIKVGRRKRKLSPAARARIVAAQKARWAKFHARKKGK